MGYDADLNLSSLTSPAGTTTFAYDNDGLLTRAGALTITRSQASGRVTGLTLGGTATTRTYNSFNEPLTESTALPRSAQYTETYARDAIGRIRAKTETAPSGASTTFAYTYDPAGRLTEVTKNGNPYRAYSFDENGNRTQATRQTPEGPETEQATYDAQDKQTTSGDYDLTYNANGELAAKTNRLSDAEQTYTYGALGALKSVTTPDGTEITYKYDAQGNRVETRTGGEQTQRLIYAPGLLGPVAELETQDRPETRFIYASRINVPDYMVRGGQTFRLVTDQLGSVRFVVDSATGEIAQEITYDPFGEVISDSAPGFQPFGFAGGLYSSETGLTHFGAREYDAGLGRWTSADPISFAGGDSNLYGYVIQDPVNLLDPYGTDWIESAGQAGMSLGDNITGGASKWVRNRIGLEDIADECSTAYKAGGIAAMVLPIPGLGKVKLAGKAGRMQLDALSGAGRAEAKGGRTAAGRSYQKHMDRGDLPNVPGKGLDRAGQDLLDDILTHPGSTRSSVTTGRAAGGTRIVRPDGTGVTFNPDGSLAYFGRYP